MGLANKNKAAHVRSAKKWLEKAEKSFDNQATVQGELNLMLAEAEMENLRKKRGTQKWLQAAAAAMLCLLCLGGAFWLKQPTSAETSMPIEKTAAKAAVPALPSNMPAVPAEDTTAGDIQEKSSAVPDIIPEDMASSSSEESPAAPILQAETGRNPSREETAPPPVPHHTTPAVKQVLSERQVQEAVQDARHSLRGTAVIQK